MIRDPKTISGSHLGLSWPRFALPPSRRSVLPPSHISFHMELSFNALFSPPILFDSVRLPSYMENKFPFTWIVLYSLQASLKKKKKKTSLQSYETRILIQLVFGRTRP